MTSYKFENELGTITLVWTEKSAANHQFLHPSVTKELPKYIVGNNVFVGANFVGANNLHPFLQTLGLLDETKPLAAREFFINKIQAQARQFTLDVKKANGYYGVFMQNGKTLYIHNPSFRRGYEHILRPSWGGDRTKKFLEVEELRAYLSYADEHDLYTLEELDEMIEMLQSHRNRRQIDIQDHDPSNTNAVDSEGHLSLHGTIPIDTQIDCWSSRSVDIPLPSSVSKSTVSSLATGGKRKRIDENHTIVSQEQLTPALALGRSLKA